MFISCSSLWTDFCCVDADKTCTYLERSKSSPINLSLSRDHDLAPSDPFLQIIPRAIGRLESLSIKGTPENLQDITTHLSRPAPLLDFLSIDGGSEYAPRRNPVLASPLFNEDLSPLRDLRLRSVRTELPWRNMVNLTSFTLACTSPGEISVRQLLDFFESAPRLCKVQLHSATPTSGAQDGRLVSLACLEWLSIFGSKPSSLLLNHLLIPVGAKLTTRVDLLGPLIEDHLPRSLDNLRNLTGFTEINLSIAVWYPRVQFSGPNGQVAMVPATPRIDTTHLVLESLARFDTSKVERLEINRGDPSSRDLPYQTFLLMKSLRILTLSDCRSPHIFIDALRPRTSSEVLICPELEELVLVLCVDEEALNITAVAQMAAMRALRGAKLKSVKIVGHDEAMWINASKLKEHVLCVKCGPDVSGTDDGSDEEC